MSGWGNSKSGDGGGNEPAATDWNGGDTSVTAAEEVTFGNGAEDTGVEGGNERVCRHCNEPGHFMRECPSKPEGFGKCFNCGQEGHSKAECPNPYVFSGTCRICEKEGHPARDCPEKPPVVCRNCKQEGHVLSECKNNMVFDLSHIADMQVEEAWGNLVSVSVEAVKTQDLDDFREAIKVYQKAVEEVSYNELERSFRTHGLGIYLIATEAEMLNTHTLVDLSGKRDCKYKVGFFFKKTPRTAKMAEVWPSSEEENLERLKDAGLPMERGIPKCLRCKGMGHISKDCKEEVVEFEKVTIKCFNCEEEGHRVRDCPQARQDRFACRNCKQSGHNAAQCTEPRSAEGVECKRCQEIGHFAKDCPNSGGNACRNCGEEGHISKDCDKPRNPATTTCRNCDEVGHFSKECPKPRDYSRVKCNNCGEMGHTVKRCKQPIAAADESGGFDDGAGGFGENTGDGDLTAGENSGWDAAEAPVDAGSGWDTAPAANEVTAW